MSENAPSMGLADAFFATKSAIGEIDQVLDTVQDAEANAKYKVRTQLMDTSKEQTQDLVNQLVPALDGMAEEQRYGVVYGLIQALEDAFGQTASKYVETVIATNPSAIEKPSEDELKKLQDRRSELAKQEKVLSELVIMYGSRDPSFDPAPYEPTKRRSGGRGKRGPRAISLFKWFIDGVEQTDTEDKTKNIKIVDLAAKLGYKDTTETVDGKEKKLQAATQFRRDLQKHLALEDLKSLPQEIDFPLPDGRTLRGEGPELDEEDEEASTDDENNETQTD